MKLMNYIYVKICEIYKLKAGIFMHQMVYSDMHIKLFLSITKDDLPLPRNTRDSSNLYAVYFPGLMLLKYSFQYQFSKIWNHIPVQIKQIIT